MEIDDELATYLQPGPFSVMVANADSGLRPEVVRAWAPCVSSDGQSIAVCVGRRAAGRLLRNLRGDGRLALSICNVTSYQSLQLKGRCVEIGEADPEDLARLWEHQEAFVAGVQQTGLREQAARGLLVSDVIRLLFIPESLYDQTPGPEAGAAR